MFATILFIFALVATAFFLSVKLYEQSSGAKLIPVSIHDQGEQYADKIEETVRGYIAYINKKTVRLLLRVILTQFGLLAKVVRKRLRDKIMEVTSVEKKLGGNGSSSSFLHKVVEHKRENGDGSIEK